MVRVFRSMLSQGLMNSIYKFEEAGCGCGQTNLDAEMVSDETARAKVGGYV